MSRLKNTFDSLKASGQKGLIIYITAGYPNFAVTVEAVLAAEKAGANVVELGIPFSDPMADGPIIQQAATEALKAGATTAKALIAIKEIRAQSSIALAAMTYYNIVLQYGVEKFVRDFSAAGLDGLIIPDLPIEESAELEHACRQGGIDLVQFIAPTSTEERIVTSCSRASGFIYCVSNTGVTGVREVDYSQVGSVIEVARKNTQLPVAIGFGIGTPQAAKIAAQYADAVIVGSAVVTKLTNEGVGGVSALIADIRKALDSGTKS